MKIKILGKISGTHAANAKTHRVDHSIKSETFSVQKKYWLTDHHSGSSLLFDVDCRVCCCALKHIQIHSTGNNLSGSPWINMWEQGFGNCALSLSTEAAAHDMWEFRERLWLRRMAHPRPFRHLILFNWTSKVQSSVELEIYDQDG